jgi:hypothetical protein
MGPQRLWNSSPHFDEFMHDAAVYLQIDRDSGRPQLVGIQDAFVDKRVALGQPEPCRRHAVYIWGIQRSKSPIGSIGRVGQVVVEKVLDSRLFQNKAMGKGFVGGRVCLGRTTWIKQELQGQRQALVSGMNCAGRCQSTTARRLASSPRLAPCAATH